MLQTERRGLLAVLAGASLLGFGALFVRWAGNGGATVLSIGFYRMAFGLPGALFLATRSGDVLGDRRGRNWALLAGGLFFFDLWLWHLAMQSTGAANATLLAAGLSPIWVALAAMAFLKLRYGWLGFLGQFVGLLGATLLGFTRGARLGLGEGELWAIGASFCYAAFTLVLGRARRTLSAPQALWWLSLSCMLCFGAATFAHGDSFAGYTGVAWASLIGLGVVIQGLAWWLNTWGLGHVEPALGAICLQGQQIATIFLAWVVLGETLKPLGLLGAAAIVGGIVLVSQSPKRVAS